jgi:hypothetical protein
MDKDYLGLFQNGKLIAVLCLEEPGLLERWYGEGNLEMNRIGEQSYLEFVENHFRENRPGK